MKDPSSITSSTGGSPSLTVVDWDTAEQDPGLETAVKPSKGAWARPSRALANRKMAALFSAVGLVFIGRPEAEDAPFTAVTLSNRREPRPVCKQDEASHTNPPFPQD